MIATKRGMRAIAGSACVVLALLSAVAQETQQRIRWEQYTTADGLPSNRVLCIAVYENRAWAGTDDGLVLIDRGQVKKVFQPEDGLVGRVVTALALDQDTGDLWVAAYGGLSRYSAGVFQNYTSLTSGLANDVVYDVAVQNGFVWAATAAGPSASPGAAGDSVHRVFGGICHAGFEAQPYVPHPAGGSGPDAPVG